MVAVANRLMKRRGMELLPQNVEAIGGSVELVEQRTRRVLRVPYSAISYARRIVGDKSRVASGGRRAVDEEDRGGGDDDDGGDDGATAAAGIDGGISDSDGSELSSIPSDFSDFSDGEAVRPITSAYFGTSSGVRGCGGGGGGGGGGDGVGGTANIRKRRKLDVEPPNPTKTSNVPSIENSTESRRKAQGSTVEIKSELVLGGLDGAHDVSGGEVDKKPFLRKRRVAVSSKTDAATTTTTSTTSTATKPATRKRVAKAPKIEKEELDESLDDEYKVSVDGEEEDYIDETKKIKQSRVKKEKIPKKGKKKENQDGDIEEAVDLPNASPPPNWEEMYNLVKEMRAGVWAPVDTMGCEMLAEPESAIITPKIQRFQTLVSLMLSSQTKDTVTSVVVRSLQTTLPGGLTVPAIRAVDPAVLDKFIGAIGFHNRKTIYLKQTAEILHEKYNDDIPRTVAELCSLPGVGPKMAHLTMSAAWNDTQGIGVDVHVHRIVNLWGWVKTNDPEQTRIALEKWLPREKWREINKLLVGFGQTICLSRGPKCGECTLAERGLCRAAKVPPGLAGKLAGKAERVKREVKAELDTAGVENVEVKVKRETYHSGDEVEKLAAIPNSRKGKSKAKPDVELESRHWQGSRRNAKREVKNEVGPEPDVKLSQEQIPDMEDMIKDNLEPIGRKTRKR